MSRNVGSNSFKFSGISESKLRQIQNGTCRYLKTAQNKLHSRIEKQNKFCIHVAAKSVAEQHRGFKSWSIDYTMSFLFPDHVI